MTKWKIAVPYEQMRYISYVVDVCGGDGVLAAKILGIHRQHYVTHIEWTSRRIRREGGKRFPPTPRFANPCGGKRKPRPVNDKAFARLRTLEEHMDDFKLRYAKRALRQTNGNQAAASRLLGLQKTTLSMFFTRKYPKMQRKYTNPPLPPPRLSSREREQWWRTMICLIRLLTTFAMLGISISPSGITTPNSLQPAIRKEDA